MKTKHFHLFAVCCILALLSSCKEEDEQPLSFYDSAYEVPMGGKRYLGIKSGNGDYSIEVKDTRIATSGTETGWSGVPAGCQIYVEGVLTGTTYLTVTDRATMETCTLPIKVVDSYESIRVSHFRQPNLPNWDENLLAGISWIFLINNHARDAYFFRQEEQTAFSSGLELITQGHYQLKKAEDDNEKATLTLTFSEDGTTPTDHAFFVWGSDYLFHRLDKRLNLGWNTSPIGETRTSPTTLPSYTLEEITEESEPGTGRQTAFSLEEMEMPFGILP